MATVCVQACLSGVSAWRCFVNTSFIGRCLRVCYLSLFLQLWMYVWVLSSSGCAICLILVRMAPSRVFTLQHKDVCFLVRIIYICAVAVVLMFGFNNSVIRFNLYLPHTVCRQDPLAAAAASSGVSADPPPGGSSSAPAAAGASEDFIVLTTAGEVAPPVVPEQRFPCQECGLVFGCRWALDKHRYTHKKKVGTHWRRR